MSTGIPSDAPPSYEKSNATKDKTQAGSSSRQYLEEPLPLNKEERRSMEEEGLELPPGWKRQFDKSSGHQFYVDTNANPPRSIWTHPYFDEQWQKDNPDEVRRLQGDQSSTASKRSSKDGDDRKKGFAERIKDKITGSTHEEREEKRRQRYQFEMQQQQAYMERRRALMEQRQQQYAQYGGNPYGGYAAPSYGYRRGGFGGAGLPLAFGLGGGLLLGSALGDGGGDYGGGGGDFGGGGGDFGGGGFGGDGGGGGGF